MKQKIEKILDKYYPIDWADPDPSLEIELEALIFDDAVNFNPIDDDIEEVKERIMNTLYQLNKERKLKDMIEDRAKQVDKGFIESYPKKYK